MATEMTLCYVLEGDKLLLKYAARGISKGKWNGLGGGIEKGETPEQCAVREAWEESGLMVSGLFNHGMLHFHFDGSSEPQANVHVFSTKSFTGHTRSTEEGEVKWFNRKDLPFDKMWTDDAYWFNLMFSGKRFEGSFHFGKDGNTIIKHELKEL